MAAQSILEGDVHVTGVLTAADMRPSTGSITNAMVDAAAAIDATKVQQQYLASYRVATPVTVTEYTHIARGAGTIVGVRAVIDTAPAAGNSYTIDVQKNGVTILSSTISVTDATTPDSILTGTLSVTSYVANDLFRVVVTTTGGGSKGTGLLVQTILRESANP
jgi:hypothetical protein